MACPLPESKIPPSVSSSFLGAFLLIARHERRHRQIWLAAAGSVTYRVPGRHTSSKEGSQQEKAAERLVGVYCWDWKDHNILYNYFTASRLSSSSLTFAAPTQPRWRRGSIISSSLPHWLCCSQLFRRLRRRQRQQAPPVTSSSRGISRSPSLGGKFFVLFCFCFCGAAAPAVQSRRSSFAAGPPSRSSWLVAGVG